MTREQAEVVALQAVVFLLDDERALEVFMGLTGITPEHLRDNLNDKAMLAGVLEHLLGNERTVVDFCERHELDPETPARAARVLGGGHPA